MSDPLVRDSLLDRARTEASRGEWGSVRETLGPCRDEPSARPALLVLLAEADLRTGHLQDARALLHPLVPRLQAASDQTLYRRALNMSGAAAFELGLLDEAEPQFQLSLALATAAADYRTVGHATNNLGMIANIRGEFDKALSLYQLAVPAFQRVGYLTGLGETHHNMALSFREKGSLEDADRQERRAIDLAREAGNARLLAIAHVGRAELALRRGEPAVANAGARLGAEQYAAIPDRLGEADALRLMGAACTALGKTAVARASLTRALELARAHGSVLIAAEAHEALARLHATLGSPAEVARNVGEARRLYREMGASAAETALEEWYQGLPSDLQ